MGGPADTASLDSACLDSNCLMSFSDLSRAIGAELFTGEGKQTSEIRRGGFSSVSIDSRTVKEGALFVALKGGAADGHRFVDAAFKAGAAGAMVALKALEDGSLDLASLAKKWKRVLLTVEDTLKGLQDAARVYLGRFTGLLKIGITGSAGKTTTKEIAAAIIGGEKRVVMNEGNLNSETGLPLSVFRVRPGDEVCVFELGMNRRGEIAELAKVLNPDIALITNIGSAHIGSFDNRDGIALEKKKIFSEFRGSNTALIPSCGDYRDFLAEGVRGRTVFYGLSSLPPLGAVKDMGLLGSELLWDGVPARFALPGKFNLRNAAAAAALAMEVPVSAASIRRGLESVKPLFGRGEILYGRSTVIRDCYNSNPESAAAALDFCDSLEWKGRRIYVIGSMLELGGSSGEAHAALGRRLAESRANMVCLYGEETRAAFDAFEERCREISGAKDAAAGDPCRGEAKVFYTCDKDELSARLDAFIGPGDLVLLKASRGCALETLTGMLTGKKGEADVS